MYSEIQLSKANKNTLTTVFPLKYPSSYAPAKHIPTTPLFFHSSSFSSPESNFHDIHKKIKNAQVDHSVKYTFASMCGWTDTLQKVQKSH